MGDIYYEWITGKKEEKMKREEVLKELNTFKKMAKSESGKEALDMAIKALEQTNKIADIVDGAIDHFEYADAMDMLYEIKGVIK